MSAQIFKIANNLKYKNFTKEYSRIVLDDYIEHTIKVNYTDEFKNSGNKHKFIIREFD